MDINDLLVTAIATGAEKREPLDLPNGGKGVLVPQGYQLKELAPIEPNLTRIRGGVTMVDLDSWVAYVNRFKSEDTQVFASPDPGSFHVTAVLDYHNADGLPAHCAHKAVYAPRYAVQWQRWSQIGTMEQVAFAEFIEENRADVQEPAAAVLLDIITKFKATKKAEYDSVVYQPNGDVMIGWSEKTEAVGKAVAVPTELKLGIPVFFRGTLYAVPAFLRYRLDGGKLRFQVKLDRPEYIEEAAIAEITKAVGEQTGLTVYLGRQG